MEKNTMKILLASVLIVAGAGAAMAQGPRGEGMTFDQLDVDGSGEITAEDLTALRNDRFAALDSNGDGTVSKDEFLAAQRMQAAEAVLKQTRAGQG